MPKLIANDGPQTQRKGSARSAMSIGMGEPRVEHNCYAASRVFSYNSLESAPMRHRVAMVKEINDLFIKKAIEIVDIPIGAEKSLISATWVNNDKEDPTTGEIIRTKSRLCPRGFEQKPGIHFNPDEVAAPTVGLSTIMLFYAIAHNRGQKRRIVDVDAAFSIPKCKETILMKFPLGLISIPGKALRLNNSLNGTKQSGYNWHEIANDHLNDQKYTRSTMNGTNRFSLKLHYM